MKKPGTHQLNQVIRVNVSINGTNRHPMPTEDALRTFTSEMFLPNTQNPNLVTWNQP